MVYLKLTPIQTLVKTFINKIVKRILAYLMITFAFRRVKNTVVVLMKRLIFQPKGENKILKKQKKPLYTRIRNVSIHKHYISAKSLAVHSRHIHILQTRPV